jgi:hypothetical protein
MAAQSSLLLPNGPPLSGCPIAQAEKLSETGVLSSYIQTPSNCASDIPNQYYILKIFKFLIKFLPKKQII